MVITADWAFMIGFVSGFLLGMLLVAVSIILMEGR